MEVLIIDRDIFTTAGGGQAVYRRLIELNPSIHFSYFIEHEQKDDPRPPNAHPIQISPLRMLPGAPPEFVDLSVPRCISKDFQHINHFFSAVRGRRFDVIDFPDYLTIGYLIRPALEYFGIQVKKIAIALHGSVSTTVSYDDPQGDFVDVPWNLREQWQFGAADIRYAISEGYAAEWNELSPYPIDVVDPIQFVDHQISSVNYPVPQSLTPTLSFIGRPEQRKGPDIFLDILESIDSSLNVSGLLIGPDIPNAQGESTKNSLLNESKRRGSNLLLVPAMSSAELKAHYAQRTIAVVPSRYDSFNLVALEAILQGCPLAVGKGAKVVEYLRRRFPSLPFVEIDTDNPRACLGEVEAIIGNYDEYRSNLRDILSQLNCTPQGNSLYKIYSAPSCRNVFADSMFAEWYLTAQRQSLPGSFPPNTIGSVYRELWHAPEEREEQLLSKLRVCWQVANAVRLDRVRLWREIARLERMRGNDLLWATYSVRVMRSMGQDYFGVLPEVVEVLNAHQYLIEGQALRAMYGSIHERRHRGSALLDHQFQQHKERPRFEHSIYDDRRGTLSPKVSVIVSMYNAGSKLALFLKKLSQQTILKSRAMEIILVDSGSPSNEYEVFKRDSHNLPILYIRSLSRETIQCAWNRGISEARGDYLAFLGVDESVSPDAFEILSNELDRDTGIDWVIGDSVITNVDAEGNFLSEVNRYNRQGYHQDLVSLETCYLSWVGALYRKTIHDRFGYYDPSFRGAGDTEFKSRILPHIRSKAVPQLLGIFLNYPEERTTESPMAELEDIRAWYLHRSAAGVQYAFEHRSEDEIADQIKRALSYRKSYARHLSTDFDYAAELLSYLGHRAPNHPLLNLQPGVLKLKSAIVGFEYVSDLTLESFQRAEQAVGYAAGVADEQHRKILQVDSLPYRILNDNRFEQHHWPWSNQATTFTNKVGRRYYWR